MSEFGTSYVANVDGAGCIQRKERLRAEQNMERWLHDRIYDIMTKDPRQRTREETKWA